MRWQAGGVDELLVEAMFPGESDAVRQEWLELNSVFFELVGPRALAPQADLVVAWLKAAELVLYGLGQSELRPYAFLAGTMRSRTLRGANAWDSAAAGLRSREFGLVGGVITRTCGSAIRSRARRTFLVEFKRDIAGGETPAGRNADVESTGW